MVLAASSGDKSVVELIDAPEDAKVLDICLRVCVCLCLRVYGRSIVPLIDESAGLGFRV